MPEQPLWSERHGGSLPLSKRGFATLLIDAFSQLASSGYLDQVLRVRMLRPGRNVSRTAEAFFSIRLGDPWPESAMRVRELLELREDSEIFDLIELLHREVVSARVARLDAAVPPGMEGSAFDTPEMAQLLSAPEYDKTAGQAAFRSKINPILARRDPPLELTEDGVIVERTPELFRRLVEQPLPEIAPKQEVADRWEDAVAHYRRRDATAGDRRAAVRELADVLEFLRADVKKHLLTQDERDLFRIANEFALRHNKPTTRRDFEEPVWLAWLFYVYLATIRLVLDLKQREAA